MWYCWVRNCLLQAADSPLRLRTHWPMRHSQVFAALSVDSAATVVLWCLMVDLTLIVRIKGVGNMICRSQIAKGWAAKCFVARSYCQCLKDFKQISKCFQDLLTSEESINLIFRLRQRRLQSLQLLRSGSNWTLSLLRHWHWYRLLKSWAV